MLGRALQFVREHPARAARLKIRNAIHLLDPRLLPRYPAGEQTLAAVRDGRVVFTGLRTRPSGQEAAQAVAQALVLVCAAFGFAARGLTRADEPVLLIVFTEALVCVVFFPTTRLLAPSIALLLIYAGAGAADLARRMGLTR
jgi:hypothetical protein